MSRLILPAAAAVLLLTGAMLLPHLVLSDTVAAAASPDAAAPKGYRSCFMERQLVVAGVARLETKRRCVFQD